MKNSPNKRVESDSLRRRSRAALGAMITKIVCFLIVSCLLGGCAVSTERFTPEYSREYFLAADTRIWTDCRLWTGWYSLNIGGPETVYCIVSERYNSPPSLSAEKIESDRKRMVTLKKGSLVSIMRIFTITHTGVSNAELLITDSDSGTTTRVFAEYWPTENPRLLVTK
ncbi:hypothetical protein D3C78_1317000 [compost metagenome]